MNETNYSNFEIDNYKRANDLLTHKINLSIKSSADKVYTKIKEQISLERKNTKSLKNSEIKGMYEIDSLIGTEISKDEYKAFFDGYYVKTKKFVFKQKNGKEYLFLKFKDIRTKKSVKGLMLKIFLFTISIPLLGVLGFLYKRKTIVVSGDYEFNLFSNYLKEKLNADGIASFIAQKNEKDADGLKEKLILYYKAKGLSH